MNKVVKNYIYNLSYQILILLVPLITTPYVSRVLGVKGVGVFSYTNSIVQYFILFGCIGLNLYGQREVAYHQHKKENRDKTFWEIMIVRFYMVSLSLVVYFYTFAFRGKYADIFLIMSLDIFAAMIDISWFFQGIEDFRKIVARNLIVKIAGVFLIFLCVKTSDDLNVYIICHSSALFLGNLSMWAYIPKLVGRVPIGSLQIKRHIRPMIVMFFPQIATSIYTVLDKTMIGALTGMEEEVAYYEQGQKIVKITMSLVTSLGTVMLPRVANLYKQNELEKIKQYLSKSFRFAFFLSFPMMFGLMAVSRSIVPWFFGNGYDKVVPNMMVISPILVVIALSNIMGTQYLLPTGRQKEFTLSVVTGCCINFIMNFLLIPRFLSIGAAIASVVAELGVTTVQTYFIRNEFDFKKIIGENEKYILSSCIMFVPTYCLALRLTPSPLSTCICTVVGAMVYVGVLILLKDQQVLEFLAFAKNKLKKLP